MEIKIQHDGVVRLLAVSAPDALCWSGLAALVNERFSLGGAADGFALWYPDQDGDWIKLDTDVELQHRLASGTGIPKFFTAPASPGSGVARAPASAPASESDVESLLGASTSNKGKGPARSVTEEQEGDWSFLDRPAHIDDGETASLSTVAFNEESHDPTLAPASPRSECPDPDDAPLPGPAGPSEPAAHSVPDLIQATLARLTSTLYTHFTPLASLSLPSDLLDGEKRNQLLQGLLDAEKRDKVIKEVREEVGGLVTEVLRSVRSEAEGVRREFEASSRSGVPSEERGPESAARTPEQSSDPPVPLPGAFESVADPFGHDSSPLRPKSCDGQPYPPPRSSPTSRFAPFPTAPANVSNIHLHHRPSPAKATPRPVDAHTPPPSQVEVEETDMPGSYFSSARSSGDRSSSYACSITSSSGTARPFVVPAQAPAWWSPQAPDSRRVSMMPQTSPQATFVQGSLFQSPLPHQPRFSPARERNSWHLHSLSNRNGSPSPSSVPPGAGIPNPTMPIPPFVTPVTRKDVARRLQEMGFSSHDLHVKIALDRVFDHARGKVLNELVEEVLALLLA